MMKMTFLAGVGVGYVLGARAGRQRYEQLKSSAQGVWTNPKVQETVSQAQDFASHKAPEVQHKVMETASSVAHRVTEKVGSDSDTKATNGDRKGTSSDGEPPAGFVENPAK